VQRAPRPELRLRHLHRLRLGSLRVTSLPVLEQEQLSLAVESGWRTLDARARGTRFLELPVSAALNSPATTGMSFWSLNPYVGCEFGCTYCYARDTHRYAVERALAAHRVAEPDAADFRSMESWEAFERRILVKSGLEQALVRTLDPARLDGAMLLIGTATDPYQPAERRFGRTRLVLQRLLGWRGLKLGITTKSPLILRDLPLLRRLAERHEVSVSISLATLDARLARRLELRSPVPSARLRALARLRAAGIDAGLMIAPIVPGITDGRAALDALLGAAKEAGARWVVGSALRLGPAARRRFLPYLAREFPELARRYERAYARRNSPGRAYVDALHRRLHELKRRHGFAR
jgi:DNA repair photolyase